MDERASIIKVGGKEHELLLTTRATREISARFGGLGELGKRFEDSENFEQSLDDLVWLIVLLANQSTLRHNFENPDDQRKLLTAEELELYTQPQDFAGFKDAIIDALYKGTKREVQSGDGDSKN